MKGKTEPERIYALLGDEDVADSAEFKHVAELIHEMLDLLPHPRLGRRRKGASQRACAAPEHFGLDEICNIYRARIRSFRETPPPDSWDGVYRVRQEIEPEAHAIMADNIPFSPG